MEADERSPVIRSRWRQQLGRSMFLDAEIGVFFFAEQSNTCSTGRSPS